MARFDAFEDMVSVAVDATFAEAFTWRPRTAGDPNARTSADGTRSTRALTGVFDDRARVDASAAGGPPHVTPEPELSVDTGALPVPPPLRGDRFLRLKTGDVYEMTSAAPDGLGRTKIRLKLVGREAVA